MITKLVIIISITFLIFCWTLDAKAQQNIIIVPSPDVLKKGQIYARLSYRFRPFGPEQYELLIPSIVYGISDTSEVYVAVSGMDLENKVRPSLDLSYKKIFQMTGTTRLTMGSRLGIDLKHSITPINFNYAHIAKSIPLTRTRFTGGIYSVSGNHLVPQRTGALLGFEQYIIPKKLEIDVDWISRNEPFSFLAAGFKIRPRPDIVIQVATLIPNGNKSKFGFIIFVGKIFR